jgi:hypothetical protein
MRGKLYEHEKIQVFRAGEVAWIEYGDDGDKLATYCDNNLAQD